jgi:radical SAM superfamily enzyme YgiQ (UPF0313 family)
MIYDGPISLLPISFDYYGVGPTTPEYGSALKIKDRIKALNPESKIIIGGAYATLEPEQCVADGFDCVVVGDGEVVSDIAFRADSQILYAPEMSLDDYPIPDRSLLNIRGYEYLLNDRPATTIVTGRGCPFHCAFCCKNHDSVRLLSAEKAIAEIDYLHDQLGYDALAFPEDIFILNKKRAETIFAHLKKRGIISRCLVRADVITKHGTDFVKTMADSGCTGVGIGIESGSDTILKNINKGESIDTIKKAIRMIKNIGIYVKGFFIVGLPGESKKTILETKAFLKEMQLDDVDIKIFQPYPGSPIWDNKEAYDIHWKDNPNYDNLFYKGRPGEYFGSVQTSHLTTRQIYDEWVSLESEFKHA